MERVIYITDIELELPGILRRLWAGAAGEEETSGVRQTEGVSAGVRPTGIYAVVDGNVVGRFAPALKAAGIEWMPFEAREERKSLEGLQVIVGWLLEREADRGALLLGIGGGVVTDITAFAASVYKRGIKYALVPTTWNKICAGAYDASGPGRCFNRRQDRSELPRVQECDRDVRLS